MRKRACALMMTLCLLTGCSSGEKVQGSGAQELALQIRTEYLAMASCAAVVDMTADYGQRVYEYTVSVTWQKDGETVLTVLKPEILAGVTARIDNDTGYLLYDSVSIETGALTGKGMSPVEAIPMVLEQVCTGYMAECGFEQIGDRQQLWFLCRDPDNASGTGIETAFWFDVQTHELSRAEIFSDGYSVVRCSMVEFTKE